jgi:hypothetical protein
LDIRRDCRLEEPFKDFGSADVGRKFSSDFEDGMEREGMTVKLERASPDLDNYNSLLMTWPPSMRA